MPIQTRVHHNEKEKIMSTSGFRLSLGEEIVFDKKIYEIIWMTMQ